MEKRVETRGSRIAAVFFYVAAALGLAALVFFAGNGSIWYDESFSLGVIRHSYGDVLRLTAADMHPPLYFLLLKLFVDAARGLGIGTVAAAKLCSAVPYMLVALLAATKVRRIWGNLTAAVFALCVVAMPQMAHYGVEIRMYSWGMLFVTCGYVWTWDVLHRGGFGNWCAFVLFGLAAAYTHYFACVAAAFNYLYLLIHFVARDRARIKAWLLCAAATVIGYAPWLPALARQYGVGAAKFWIGPITRRTLRSYVLYVFRQGTGGLAQLAMVLLAAVCLGAVVCGILRAVRRRQREEIGELAYCAGGMKVLAGTVLFGVVLSLLVRPLFTTHYMIPALGCFWLSVAILVCRIEGPRLRFVRAAMLCALLLVALINLRAFSIKEGATQRAFAELQDRLATLEEDARLVTPSSHINYSMAVLTGKDCYYLNKSTPSFFNGVLENTQALPTVDTVRQWLEGGESVYFWERLTKDFPSAEQAFSGIGVGCVNLGDYTLEDYQITLYQLRLDDA